MKKSLISLIIIHLTFQFAYSQIGWQVKYSNPNTAFFSVYFVDSSKGWVSGYYGEILYTSNGGLNWIQQNSGVNSLISSLYFVNEI